MIFIIQIILQIIVVTDFSKYVRTCKCAMPTQALLKKKNLTYFKGQEQESEKTAHRMGDFCKAYTWQETCIQNIKNFFTIQ